MNLAWSLWTEHENRSLAEGAHYARKTKLTDMAAVEIIDEIDVVDDTRVCLVCFEPFDTTNILPRLLPCSHTLCETCVTQLMRGGLLMCPQCRKKHSASGVQAFPQNRYILKYLEDKSAAQQENEKCADHGRNLSFYCKNDDCDKAICHVCLLQKHRGHSVSDFIDEKKVVAGRVQCILEHLGRCTESLQVAQQESEKKFKDCAFSLNKMKAEVISQFDHLLEMVRSETQNDIVKIQQLSSKVEQEVKNLNKIKNEIDAKQSFKDVTSAIQAVEDARNNTENIVKEKIEYSFFTPNEEAVFPDESKMLCCFQVAVSLPKHLIQTRFEIKGNSNQHFEKKTSPVIQTNIWKKLEMLGSIVSRLAHYDACANLSTLCKHGFF